MANSQIPKVNEIWEYIAIGNNNNSQWLIIDDPEVRHDSMTNSIVGYACVMKCLNSEMEKIVIGQERHILWEIDPVFGKWKLIKLAIEEPIIKLERPFLI